MSAPTSPNPPPSDRVAGDRSDLSPGNKSTRSQVEQEAEAELADAKAALARAEAALARAEAELADAKAEVAGAKAMWQGAGSPETGLFAQGFSAAMQNLSAATRRVDGAQATVRTLSEAVFGQSGPRAQRRRLNGEFDVVDSDTLPEELRPGRLSVALPWALAAEGSPLMMFTHDLTQSVGVEVPVEQESKAKDAEATAPLLVFALRSWPLFRDLSGGGDQYLVVRDEARKCYEVAWARRSQALTDDNLGNGFFSVITGAPGSGKSRGLSYLLHLALTTEGERTARGAVIYEARNISMAFAWLPQWNKSDGSFAGYAAYSTDINAALGTPLAGLRALAAKNTVYIIDTESESAPAGSGSNPWRYNIVCAGSVNVAASPKPTRLRDFGVDKKEGLRANLCCDPWTVNELCAARRFMGWTAISEETLRARIAEVGPLPRFLRNATFESQRECLAGKVSILSDGVVSRLFLNDETGPNNTLVSSSALVYRRKSTVRVANPFGINSFYLTPASAFVATLLGERFVDHMLQDYTLQACEQAPLMGKLFEAAALLVLSVGTRARIAKLTPGQHSYVKGSAERLYRAGYAHAYQSDGEPTEGGAKLEFVDGDTGEVVSRWAGLKNPPADGAQPTILVPSSAKFPAVDAMTHCGFAFQVTQAERHTINADLIKAAIAQKVEPHLVFVVPWFRESAYKKAMTYRGEGSIKQYVMVLTKEEIKTAFQELARAQEERSDVANVLMTRLARYF